MGNYYDTDGSPITADAWMQVFGDPTKKIVKQTDAGGYHVSTVWLGLDHRFSSEGPPLIFETMLFGDGERNGEQHRYSTRDEALSHHESLVAELGQ